MRFTWALVSLLGVFAVARCGKSSGPDPFAGPEAGHGAEGGAPGDDGGDGGEGAESDPSIGGPCLDDAQCDDAIDCTVDACDRQIGRCRHLVNDARCDDGVYCNGAEVCDRSLGCRAAAVPTCSDDDTCTIDTCIEVTQSCRHEPRDADGDGDPARACGGGDCRDDDPLISSSARERCQNQVDDNCDGTVDEADCVAPEHDRCANALVVEAEGAYELSLAGAAADYAFSCAEDASALRDVVVAVMVPAGDPVDVDVTVTVPTGDVLVAASTRCGAASREIACEAGADLEDDGQVARILVRSPEPGEALAVLVAGTAETNALVKVAFRPSEPAPANETCGTARELEPGVVERATLTGIERDLELGCRPKTGELVYFFDLDEPRDVRLSAVSLEDYAVPVISLRSSACTEELDELSCRAASPTELFARALPAGRYYVALAGTGPSDVELVFRTEPPTFPPADEGCAAPPEIPPGVTIDVSLADHVDAVRIGCLEGAADSAATVVLEERSDVMLVQTGSDGDRGAPLIALSPCASESDALACRASKDWPVRTVARGVGPGSVRAIVETSGGTPTTLTMFERPATPTVLVPRADDCTDAFEIPETGGRFQGNTQNAYPDFTASCDYGGQPPGGAQDQLLKLTLTEHRRMVFDMAGSDYDTLLVVRNAETCPGSEVPMGCAPGYISARSFLDLELDAGTYYVQIDGYNGVAGAWKLDVFGAARAVR